MFEGWHASSGAMCKSCRWGLPVLVVLGLLASVGCQSVAVSVEQPVGARVELYKKAKWFGAFGPEWGTSWDNVTYQTVEPARPVELELRATSSWVERTFFNRHHRYRACFDLTSIKTYDGTPGSVVEVRYLREVIPPKHQDILRLWHEGRTLDALTHVPVDVLADVLYNLGGKFKLLLDREVPAELQVQAAKDFRILLEAADQASPKEVESWLKSFLTKEQLTQVCGWVKNGVTLTDVRWVRLGGEPKHEGVPVFWRVIKGFVELFVRQPEIRCTRVDFLRDVIVRDLLVKKVESKLVSSKRLKYYAEVLTYDTTYYSDRALPQLNLVEDTGLAEVVAPTAEQEAELQRFGMTRSVRLDPKARAAAIRDGLPPVGLKATQVTTLRSQVVGALIEGELAYVVVWNNPKKDDPVRYLTTVITTTPYGMADVWAYRGSKRVMHATAAFEKPTGPVGNLLMWVVGVLDQRELFVKLDKPLAVFAFGPRRIDPFPRRSLDPVSLKEPAEELTTGP
jgi:hypothetical protein